MVNTHDSYCTVGMDHFGRAVQSVGGFDKEKQVGIFYFLWTGQGKADDIYDATKIMALENGKDILFYQDVPGISPEGHFHWWGEPLFGYYNNADPYILRKHMEMLTAAGVDYITFDTTNAVTYYPVYITLLSVIDEMIKEGHNPPKISFYTHTHSMKTVMKLYEDLYSKNLYPDTWYRVNGKPFIVAFTNPESDKAAEVITVGSHTDYDPKPYPQEVADFFYFVSPQWPMNEVRQDAMPWIEWVYPQPLHGEYMSVCLCSHPAVPLSASITRGWLNFGRGYDPYKKQNISEDVDKGTFFQHEWDTALQSSAKKVFVTGWNEWIAIKTPWNGEYMLCDAASREYSRDIEPMKGGYEDAFYLQLVQNIRRFKGTGKPLRYAPVSIDITGDAAQWEQAAVYHKIGKDLGRDYKGGAKTVYYKQDPPVNLIQVVRFAHDEQHFYVKAQCEKELNGLEASGFMNLYLGLGQPTKKGWETYEYLAVPQQNELTLYKLDEQHQKTPVGKGRYVIKENEICMELPRAALSAQTADTVYFKLADQTGCEKDIMNTYTHGCALPMGRLSCEFKMK